MDTRLFISHISEERGVANLLKETLVSDFLGMCEVFVSSDTESISAGEDWLASVRKALGDCAIFMILCSPESIDRPWIIFEAGAAWMRDIPLIPLCHRGLMPTDLRMPLSLKQAVPLGNPEGLERLYIRVAEVLKCKIPRRNFGDLANQLTRSQTGIPGPSQKEVQTLERDRAIRMRINEALESSNFKWRTLDRVAATAAISEEQAADLLRSNPEVRFSIGKSGHVIVGLRSRVGGKGKSTR